MNGRHYRRTGHLRQGPGSIQNLKQFNKRTMVYEKDSFNPLMLIIDALMAVLSETQAWSSYVSPPFESRSDRS